MTTPAAPRRPLIAVIPAAGRGERLGGGTPKALRSVGGMPLLSWAVRLLAPHAQVLAVAAPPGCEAAVTDLATDILRAVGASGAVGAAAGPQLVVVTGGAERTDSVRTAFAAGWAALLTAPPGGAARDPGAGQGPDPAGVDVLVHDAARPLTPAGVVVRVRAALRTGAAAVVPVVPVVDTIKEVDAAGRVLRTLDRTDLRLVQTPQGFTAAALQRALAGAGGAATDDAGLAERCGVAVLTVAGDDLARKITTAADVRWAETVLAGAPAGCR